MPRSTDLHPNLAAFLDMIAASEIGAQLLGETDDGYNVLVGATPAHPLTFRSYAAHPNILNHECNSTAAGRYQVLHRFAVDYINLLGLTDFSPVSQDKIAIRQITERHAISYIVSGNLQNAIRLCSNIWASLPGNDYEQHINNLAVLQGYFTAAGGSIA